MGDMDDHEADQPQEKLLDISNTKIFQFLSRGLWSDLSVRKQKSGS